MPRVPKLVATTFNLRRGNLSPEVKIVVIGQASVGKTAMILQYISGKFIEDYTPQCATLYEHSVQMDNTNVGIHIWDTAGQFEEIGATVKKVHGVSVAGNATKTDGISIRKVCNINKSVTAPYGQQK
nr:GTP-binding protein RHO4-like [Lepeophtheirus salmonis]